MATVKFCKVDIYSGFPMNNQKFIDLLWRINQERYMKKSFTCMYGYQFLSSVSLSFTTPESESWIDLWRHKDIDSVSTSSYI